MKPTIRILPLLIAAATLAHSQESIESATAPVTSTTARILGEIPDGTPPPPQAPKPEFHISPTDVLDTESHEQGGRTIIIRQIKPIALPPQPAPVVPSAPELDAEFSQRLAEYREAHPKSDLLFLSATVFRSSDSPPRTLVRYWPDGKGGKVTFWSSADFALVAGGINSFMDSAGDSHHLLIAWSYADIERITNLRAAQGLQSDLQDMPEFEEGKATFQITGEQPAAGGLAVIQSLHDIYNNDLARLQTAFEGREQARIEREAYLKANPPQPKDITLNYWRTETPARNGEGAAK